MKKKVIIAVAILVILAAVAAILFFTLDGEKIKEPEGAPALKAEISQNPGDTEKIDSLISIYRESGDTLLALQFIESISDEELRHSYLNAAYDRASENRLAVGNTMGNLTTGGLFAFDDEAIYFSDKANGNKLSKLSQGKTTVLCDDRVDSINILGEYIYFINKDSKTSIYRMKKDGTEYESIGNVNASNLIIIGNRMYFINWGDSCTVWSMDLSGRNKKKITERQAELLYACQTRLYMTDRNERSSLYSISLLNGEESLVSYDTVYFVTGYDGTLYYRNENDALNVYFLEPNGNYGSINSTRSGYINADRGEVFFVDFEDGGTICRANADGSGLTKLCRDDAEAIAIDGEYIYYFNGNEENKVFRIKKDGTGRECLN